MSELRWHVSYIMSRVRPREGNWQDVLSDIWFDQKRETAAYINDMNTRGGCVIPIRVEYTGTQLRMVDGHRRVAAALALWTTVPVEIVEGRDS